MTTTPRPVRLSLPMLLVGFLLILEALTVSVQAADQTKSPTKTPTLAPTPSPNDPTVGTALAPTTPGGTCLNAQDYGIWTTANAQGQTGFDLFPGDLQSCSERCALYLTSSQSPEYSCGGFSEPQCPSNLYAVCVRDCMARQSVLTSQPDFPNLKTPQPYSLSCAGCMGNVSQCVTQVCFTPCTGGNDNQACKDCAAENCNPTFQVCAGLNINQKQAPATDFTAIVIGAVSGGFGLLISVGIAGFTYRMRTRRLRELSPGELEALAKMQQSSLGATPTGSGPYFGKGGISGLYAGPSQGSGNNNNMNNFGGAVRRSPPGNGSLVGFRSSMGSVASNLAKHMSPRSSYGSSPQADNGSVVGALPSPSMVQLTPYQMQYEAQQRAAKGNSSPQPRPMPSARMSLMASTPLSTQQLTGGGTPLVMLWTFNAERPDELTMQVGQKLLGLEQADGWWLAMNPLDRRVGLVPVNYTTHDPASIASRRPNPSRAVPPSARMSKLHASITTTPSVKVLEMPTTPLIAIFDFEAQRPDEVTVSVGTIVLGIHEQDGWWLVRTDPDHKIGLIPSNFLEKVMISTPGAASEPTASIRNGGTGKPGPSSEPNF